jgi:hypothetical protein
VDEEQLQVLNAGVNPDRLKNNPIRLDAAAIDTLYRRILA